MELVKERVVILDGAMGSLLIDQGLEPGIPPEYWNISHPEKIQKIHSDYFKAGADVVFTNTFGGSRMKLSAHKHGHSIEQYNKAAVELAKEICPESKFIAGDIGPSGAALPPVGSATVEEFYENFVEQASILTDAGVDFFFVETMIDLKEAEAAVKAIKSISNKPIFASITYQKFKRGYFTVMGNSVVDCVKTLEEAGADVIGANCTIESKDMIDLIPLISQETSLPISAKPNAGKPELLNGKTVYPASIEDFTEDILAIINNGARLVGGCCGTDPEFIARLSERIRGD
jgi:5-methyltetrahydrofolate--homocysteine methyltransferase